VQPGDRRARLGAELLDQAAPQVGVHGQRVGLLAAAVQREHEQLRQRLVQRMLGDQCAQLRLHLVVPAARQPPGEAP
jgi:hypothetical protein